MAKNKKKRTKYLSPKSYFNPGTLKYEPSLPSKDNNNIPEKSNPNSNWITILIILIIFILAIIIALKFI